MDAYQRQTFKKEFIFHDSRMEGVEVDRELVSDMIVDLRLHGSGSRFCREENANVIEVAGLIRAYDYVFDAAREARSGGGKRELSVYDSVKINELLFSTAPHSEFAGRYRESNTLVLGAKFETADVRDIPYRMHELGKDVDDLLRSSCPPSEFVEGAVRLHHQLTAVHPFRDGNGRSLRAFTNLLLLSRDLPPVLFGGEEKSVYKDALARADLATDYADLYEVYYRQMLETYAVLTDKSL